MKKRLVLTLSASLLLSLLSSCEGSSTFEVTFENDEGVLVKGGKTVKEGEDYVFSVSPKEGYLFLSDFQAIYEDAPLLKETGFVYTIPNVTKDICISFQGFEKETYAVTFLENDTLTFEGKKTVQYGEDYSFLATPKEGFQGLPKITYAMGKEESKTLSGNNGSYSIEKVKGNLVIGSEGLKRASFAVEKPSLSEDYSFEGDENALYGEDYRFSIKVKEGYQAKGLTVLEEGNAKPFQSLANDEYLVPNVKGKLRIALVGIEKKSFDVNLDFDLEHYVFKGASKAVYGEDYAFSLVLKEGYYKGESYGFLINDVFTKESKDGTYIIHNVQNVPHIEAFGELETILNIRFSSNIEGALKNESDRIPYSQEEYRFSLSVDKKYSKSLSNAEAFALLDGVETKIEKGEDGVFTLRNPHKDVEIIIRGLEINSHIVSFYNEETKVYEAKVPEGSALTEEQLSEAEKAYEASVGAHYKLDCWSKALTNIDGDTKVYGSKLTGISSAEDLMNMSKDGRYFLENDIEIHSVINLKSFSGKLDGDGHSIFSKERLLSGNDVKGVLFDSFSGTLQNTTLDFILSNYSTGLSGVAASMDGGLIENVTSKCYFQYMMYVDSGSFVGTLNAGEIRNSKSYFIAENYSSRAEDGALKSYPIVGKIDGGLIDNVSVYVPTGADISELSFAGTGEAATNVLNCQISHLGTLKVESPFPSGYQMTKDTYLGMPLSEFSAKDGFKGTPLFASLSLHEENLESLSFYVRVAHYDYDGNGTIQGTFGLRGDSEITLTTNNGNGFDVWNYFEARLLSEGKVRIYSIPFNNVGKISQLCFAKAFETEMSASDTLESVAGRFYSWNPKSEVTLVATPLYATYR